MQQHAAFDQMDSQKRLAFVRIVEVQQCAAYHRMCSQKHLAGVGTAMIQHSAGKPHMNPNCRNRLAAVVLAIGHWGADVADTIRTDLQRHPAPVMCVLIQRSAGRAHID